MAKEETIAEQVKPRWFIDLDWFQRHNRSMAILVQSHLCAKCRKQVAAEGKKLSEADLIATIKGCCANDPEFITGQLPILEGVFRFFLANGNQPIDLEELTRQLSERYDWDTYRTSGETLSRLLKSDQYYGLQPFPD